MRSHMPGGAGCCGHSAQVDRTEGPCSPGMDLAVPWKGSELLLAKEIHSTDHSPEGI